MVGIRPNIGFFVSIKLNDDTTVIRGILQPPIVAMRFVSFLISCWGREWIVDFALNDFIDVQLNIALLGWYLEPHDLS